MFDFDEYKSYKDMVHGYIRVPMLFVHEIIDTPLFQRLRFIEQTGMRQVYPSARHDRFVHSLGTLHLGTKAVDALLKNFRNSKYWNIYSDDQREIFWAKNKVLFLIACLLHDIGHAPFSHSLEHLYIYGKNGEEREIDSLLKEHFRDKKEEEIYKEFYSVYTKENKELIPQPHETVSAVIVIDKYKKNVSRILNSLKEKKYPNENNPLVSEHAVVPKVIDDSDIDNDMVFIARMIAGITYKNYEPDKQIRNCFISLLNSTTFDVDKLDYIIRDSKMSGLDNVQLDVERLLNSLYIIPVTKFVNYIYEEDKKKFELDDTILGIDTRGFKKSNFIGNHFQGDLSIIQGKVTIGENSKIGSMIGKLDAREGGELPEFTEHSYIQESGYEVQKDKSFQYHKKLPNLDKELDVVLEHAENLSEFVFSCKKKDDNEASVKIRNFIGKIFIKDGDFQISSAAQLRGNLYGEFTKVEVLGDLLERYKVMPYENVFNSFQIGFNNSAISVIKNIGVARNYLYLWVYAHHKVVYYANYLIPELLNETAKVMGNYAYKIISYSSIPDMDDTCVVSLFREASRIASSVEEGHNKFIELYNEYKSRKYKKSLFKTLAEYDLFFIDFTPSEKDRLKIILARGKGTEQKTYGDIETGFHVEYGINSLLWIDANLSIKQVESGKIFINFGENKFYTLEQISILSEENVAKRDNPYFYVYYNYSENNQKVNPMSVEFGEFKKKLLDWFRSKLNETA